MDRNVLKITYFPVFFTAKPQSHSSLQRRAANQLQLSRETHTTSTKMVSVIWLWSHKQQCRSLNVETQTVEFIRWKRTYRKSEKASPVFSSFFTHQDELCFYHTVTGSFEATGITCNPCEVTPLHWQIIQKPQSRSFHNGNTHPSFPSGHSVQLREEYSVKI